MNNSLAIVNGSEWSGMMQVAEALVSSGFLPQSIKTSAQAVAIILAGRELGIGPWQAVQTINVIQGKPTVSPQLMLALINQSGQLEDIAIDGDGKGCIVMMKRKGRQPHTETFTFEDATKLGLSSKDNYRKQPAIMLRWRAVAACARVVFPDVILGLYTPDEMGADVTVGDDGSMTVVTVEREPEPPKNAPAPAQGQRKPIDMEAAKQQMAQQHGPIGRENVVRDWRTVFAAVRDFYTEEDDEKAKAHWWNGTVKKLEKDGVITDAMKDGEVIKAISAYKQQQAADAQFAAIPGAFA